MNELLDGITVLDFSEYIAGPFCGFLLADMGARVIKIEPPDGAEERRIGGVPRYKKNTRMSLAFNRGKESLALNLKTEEGKKIVYRLVEEADVVIQNFVPGAATKLGIDYETLAAINPKLVFVSSTAFGEVGPYKSRKGFDIIAHAASGIMANYADEEGEPRGPGGLAYIDMSTGMLNALGVVSALYHRDRLVNSEQQAGQKIESSLFSTGLLLQMMQLVHIDNLDEDVLAREKQLLATAHQQGKSHTNVIDEFVEMRLREDLPDTTRPIEVPDCKHRPGDRHVYPYYRVYETANGYMSVAALNVNQRQSLCTLLGIDDPHVKANVGALSDEAYYGQKLLMKEIEKQLKTDTTLQWMAKLETVGVPCGQVNYRPDLYADPQVQALNMMWQLQNSEVGAYAVPGNPLRFSATPIQAKSGAPGMGEHSAKVLEDFGFSADDIANYTNAGVVKV